MAEVARVLGNLQLDTEGGLVPASGTEGLVGVIPSRRRSRLVKDGAKLVKDDPAAIGATKAGRKMAVARNKAVGCSTGEIGVTKADAGNKEAAGSFTDEVGVTKAEPGNKEAAGSFTGKIDVAKADLGFKEAAGRFTGEIDVTKAEVGAAGKGVVTEASWIKFVFPVKSQVPVGIESKDEPTTLAMITKEMVPDAVMDRLKEKPLVTRLAPLHNATGVYDRFPELRDLILSNNARWNYLVDLHEDCLKQHAKKGFAELGVDFTDGVKKVFILPQEQAGCAP